MLGRLILAGLVFLMHVRLIFVGTMLLWIGVESRFSPAMFWNTVGAAATEIRLHFDQIVVGRATPVEAASNRVAGATFSAGFSNTAINH